MAMLSIIYLKNMPEILEIPQTLKVPFAPIKTLHCNSGPLRSPDHQTMLLDFTSLLTPKPGTTPDLNKTSFPSTSSKCLYLRGYAFCSTETIRCFNRSCVNSNCPI